MGDRNIGNRTITGLNPVQEVICTELDVAEKISIDGSVPTTVQFIGYDTTSKTTKYMTTPDTTYRAGIA